jgi:tetratricopeptide (TPR) repeat protein
MPGIRPSLQKALYAILLFLILSITPLVTYFNTLHNDFVFDDLLIIQGNETLSSLNSISSIINITTKKYRPVRTLSYAIDYHFSGLNPFSYHISNIVYHIINVFLIYLITHFVLKNRVAAFITALLFAVHPVHTESVTYISGRRDILFTLFYLTGFYSFLKYRKTQRFYFILFSMAAYLLSIGSKEMGVTLPAIFLVYDLINGLDQREKGPGSNPVKESIKTFKKLWAQHKYFYSPFLTGALFFTFYKVFINSPSHQKGYYGDSLLTTFLTVVKIIPHYLKLLVFPITLIADYSYDAFPLVSSPFNWSFLASATFLILLLLIIVRMVTRKKWIAFGGIWFFITLLPVCHIIPHHELLAERYLYLPSYGFCLIIALLFTSLLENKRYLPLILPAFIAIIVLFSLRIIDRNKDWKDGMALWSKTVSTVPRCARAQSNLGVEYIKEGKHTEAMSHFQSALKINPAYAEAHNNTGLVYKEQGMYDDALNSFWSAIKFKRRYFEAMSNMANTADLQGKHDNAIKLFKIIVKKRPGYAQAHNNLGVIYLKTGQLDLAEEHFSRTLTLNPSHLEALNNLGALYKNRGMYDKAIEEFKKALRINPDSAAVHCNLGTAYNNKAWYDRAISELKEALRLKPDFVDAMNNLGNAYRGKELYNKAIETYKKTLEINPDLAIPHVNIAIIYLYQEKDNRKALYHFEKALEIEPDFPQARAIRKKIEELKQEIPLA